MTDKSNLISYEYSENIPSYMWVFILEYCAIVKKEICNLFSSNINIVTLAQLIHSQQGDYLPNAAPICMHLFFCFVFFSSCC